MRLLSQKPTIPELREYRKPVTHGRICIFDSETDPFAAGASIRPFTCGFYDGETYVDFWGDDCIDQFGRYMDSRKGERLLVYAHNLGGFDVHFLYDHFDNACNPLVIGARLAKVDIFGQEWRDSFKIIPVPLRDFKKDEFDYSWNLRESREGHKEAIRLYQRHDCEYLYELVKEFHVTFGNRITIGNAAINMLQSFYGFARLSGRQDANLRDFFFGGRNQCFETGVLDDDWKVYDVNSMYPSVMRNYQHPIGATIHNARFIGEDTFFVELDAWNNGCLPIRGNGGDLDFTCRFGRFFATIHELNAGLLTGDVRIKKIHRCLNIHSHTNFAEFVDYFYLARQKAKTEGDRVRDIFYKLILNNAYGKFAQNPERYGDYYIGMPWEIPVDGMFHSSENPNGWKPKYDNGKRIIWERDSHRDGGRRPNYFNVGTGASITGAARAELYKGLRSASRAVYCDTDSIICRSLDARLSESEIGEWKLEGEGARIAIAGKKLYSLFDKDGVVVKKASKGANLSGEDIARVASGETIKYKHEVPTFGLDGSVTYLERDIQRTGAI